MTSGRDRIFLQLDNALDAQELVALRRKQQVEEHLDRRERQRAVMHKRERTDAGVMVMMRVIVVMMIMVVMVMRVFGRLAQPAAHVGGLGRRIVEAALQQLCCRSTFHRADFGAGIDATEPLPERVEPFGVVDQVGLGQHDTVGDRDLLDRLDMRVERGGAIDGVDNGDDAVEPEGVQQRRVAHDRLQHRHRIGKAGGLDHHPRQALDTAGLETVDEVGERVDELAAHRAAQAAVGKLDDAVRRLLDQQMVDGDVAELIDDDRRVGELRGPSAGG